MKKLFALIMAALLLLSLAGCSFLEKPGEFDYIVRLLEDEDYEEAIEEIYELMEDEDRDDREKDEPVMEAPEAEPNSPVEEPAVEETIAPPMPEETEAPEETTAPQNRVKLLTGLTITKVDNLGNEDSDSY